MAVFVWIVSVGIIGVNIYIVVGFLVDEGKSSAGNGDWVYAAAAIGASFYLGFVLFLMREDFKRLRQRANAVFVKLGVTDVADLSNLQQQYSLPPSALLSHGDSFGDRLHRRLPSEDDGSEAPTPELADAVLSRPNRGDRGENGTPNAGP